MYVHDVGNRGKALHWRQRCQVGVRFTVFKLTYCRPLGAMPDQNQVDLYNFTRFTGIYWTLLSAYKIGILA